jgi:long-chain fatty acid transport protein
VKSIDIKLDSPVAGLAESVTPKNWRDVLSYMVGAKYRFNDTWAASVGYLYTGNAVPDETFDPSLPDANANLYTTGVSYRKKNFTVDLAYSYQQNQSRTKNNTIDDNANDGTFNPATSANGRYTSHVNMIALSLGYAF